MGYVYGIEIRNKNLIFDSFILYKRQYGSLIKFIKTSPVKHYVVLA